MAFNLEDQRREPRVPIRFTAILNWRDEDGREITDNTHTVNISNSGASFITRHCLQVGAKIHVNFDIEGQFGSAAGEVRWAEMDEEGYQIGVSFRSD